jgi:hypothetical protein
MHAAVTGNAPGTCPICGMELVLREPPRLAGRPASAVERVQRRILNETSRAPGWVEEDGQIVAVVEPEDLADLRGGGVMFRPSATPGMTLPVHADVSPDPGGTVPRRVRFTPGRTASGATPGVVGWVEGPETSRSVLLVLASAVVHDPRGSSVLVLPAEGAPVRRFIQIGRTALGYTTVLSGLEEGERVVGGADAFFLDVDLRRREEETASRPAR